MAKKVSGKEMIAKLLEANPNQSAVQQAFRLSTEADDRTSFLSQCVGELDGTITQVGFGRADNGVYETAIVEFPDGTALKHRTWIDEKSKTATVQLSALK